MRSEADIREVFRLHAAEHSQAEIARRTGVSRATVRAWIRDGEELITFRRRRCEPCGTVCPETAELDEPAYAYLLGQYLGDGCISPMKRTFRLRITCCDLFPGIIDETMETIRRTVRTGAIGLTHREGCTEVANYWKHWPCLLPHGGGGVKHTRPIVLEPWQEHIALGSFPRQFLRGLIHSDGWRGINRVRGANGSPYAYPRYQFTNRSDDIRQLFTNACDRVGVEWRQMNRWNISVARRRSVALLDEFVGPKR